MAVGANLTSAAGVLSLLKEPEYEIRVFALNRLNAIVAEFWAEIAEDISKIEELYEDHEFPERELAALVASQVYYHLGSFRDSLTFALGAGDKFDVNGTAEYNETIISKCIDRYTHLRVQLAENQLEDAEVIDPRLEDIVNRMFNRCLHDRRYKQAVGIAFETRRVDVLERAIEKADDVPGMLSYCLEVAQALITSPSFRNIVLQVLVRFYQKLKVPDYISVCQCYIFLDDPISTAEVLEKLARGSKDDTLVAYQIAFDIYESATQHFLRRVQEAVCGSLPAPPPPPSTPSAPTSIGADDKGGVDTMVTPVQETGGVQYETAVQESQGMDTDAPSEEVKVDPQPTQQVTPEGGNASAETMDVEASPAASPAPNSDHVTSQEPEPEWMGRLRSVATILGGEVTVALHQEFLIRNNHTDLQIIENTKDSSRNSITHSAVVIMNGLMHFGTTTDVFLRENLDWLKRASNWAKFTATASLGLIHYGHEREALNLMSSYLPKDSSGNSPYAEGGGLYAIGLIHSNHGLAIMDYLMRELQTNSSEIVRHGGCLGLGLAGMATANKDAYNLLKENLMTSDDAVIGEAAGLAMGLLMIGTSSPEAIEDMTSYARETQHEKIQRGLALGISMLMYSRMEDADTLIEDLCRDKDCLLRRSGMFTIAMAYCGSGNNKAIRRLLHVAVSDVDNDVRRAAVCSIGFILFRTPEQCPHVVSLLSESFNPHVRAGSAMALGISCAGTGNKDALSLIEPMVTDPVAFVQQAALVAAAMILIQHSEAMSSKVAFYRQHCAKVVADKHEDVLTKFGAIIAQGIMDAGGRNVTISLQSRTGHMSLRTAIGLLVFSQFWFWFPLCHFLSLALTPTSLIALNADLKMPKLQFRSGARPSLYAYPAPLEKEKEKEREKVAPAILSVTAKKAKAKKAAATAAGESMEVDKKAKSSEKMDTTEATPTEGEAPPTPKAVIIEAGGNPEEGSEKMDTSDLTKLASESDKKPEGQKEAEKPEGRKEAEKKAEPEPEFEMLCNPARVLPQQLKVITMEEGSRYTPLKPVTVGGITMLRNREEGAPEEIIEPVKVSVPGQEDEEDEPEPPEPFEWTDDQ